MLGQLPQIAATQPAAAHQLLWDLGVRMVEADSSLLTISWEAAFEALMGNAKTRQSVIHVAGRVVSLACYVNAMKAHRLHRAVFATLDLADPDNVVVLLRIGASAVRAASQSLATEIALNCRGLAFDRWASWAASSKAMATEDTSSELYGGTLGPDVQLTLQRFITFAAGISDTIPLS